MRKTKWASEQQKKYANTLFSKGLKSGAITAYEKYLEVTDAPDEERAKIAYRVVSLYIEIGKHEKSLANLYRVDSEHPSTGLAANVGQKVVACLDRLDLTSQAQYELQTRTTILPDAERAEQEGTVIARIG